MKIIDFHVHTFPKKIAASALEKLTAKSHTPAFTDGTTENLSRSMQEAGINFSVILPVATSPRQVEHINDGAINTNNKNIISFGAMHPDFEDVEKEFARLRNAGIKGVKLHPVYQGVNIDDERYIKILSCSGDYNLAVIIHAGWDIGFPGNDAAMPERISRAIKLSGSHGKIILAHMGGLRCWDEAEKFFAGRENIFIDTAFSLGNFTPNGDGYYSGGDDCAMLSIENFVKIIRSYGAERVIFGTDSPWASQSESVKNFNALPLNDHEKILILYKNAASIIFSAE